MATWVTPRVWVAGERVSAAKMNEISTDLGILFPHTTAGDLAFRSSGSSDLTRLALTAGGVLAGGASLPQYVSGSAGQVLFSNGSSVASFAGLVYRREGGSATDWNNPGTNSYTPAAAYIQQGAVSVSVNSSGSASVTFPVAYAAKPLVLCGVDKDSYRMTVRTTGRSTTGFDVVVNELDTSGSFSCTVEWLAFGAI